MNITEKNAITKWCPMVRAVNGYGKGKTEIPLNQAPINRIVIGSAPATNDGFNCVGSECAMWRFVPITNPSNGARKFIRAPNGSADTEEVEGNRPPGIESWDFFCEEGPAGWIEPESEALKRRLGYCGIAGKPEE